MEVKKTILFILLNLFLGLDKNQSKLNQYLLTTLLFSVYGFVGRFGLEQCITELQTNKPLEHLIT